MTTYPHVLQWKRKRFMVRYSNARLPAISKFDIEGLTLRARWPVTYVEIDVFLCVGSRNSLLSLQGVDQLWERSAVTFLLPPSLCAHFCNFSFFARFHKMSWLFSITLDTGPFHRWAKTSQYTIDWFSWSYLNLYHRLYPPLPRDPRVPPFFPPLGPFQLLCLFRAMRQGLHRLGSWNPFSA